MSANPHTAAVDFALLQMAHRQARIDMFDSYLEVAEENDPQVPAMQADRAVDAAALITAQTEHEAATTLFDAWQRTHGRLEAFAGTAA
jgi:hypothetical protein